MLRILHQRRGTHRSCVPVSNGQLLLTVRILHRVNLELQQLGERGIVVIAKDLRRPQAPRPASVLHGIL